jgi:creatinine amidohydrolase
MCVTGGQGHDHIASDRRYLTTLGIGAYTTGGVIGYPSRATAAKGHAVLDYLGQAAYALITLLISQST